jgi:PTS system galactitol-specific IIA component
MLAVRPENILLKLDAADKREVIYSLVERLAQNGCVAMEYADDVYAREERYPTGLPTEGIRVAIPHGFSADCVKNPGVGMATLTHPVSFFNMADREEELPVSLVFLLANTDADEQVEDLRKLMGILSDGEALMRLMETSDPDEAAGIVAELIRAVEEEETAQDAGEKDE